MNRINYLLYFVMLITLLSCSACGQVGSDDKAQLDSALKQNAQSQNVSSPIANGLDARAPVNNVTPLIPAEIPVVTAPVVTDIRDLGKFDKLGKVRPVDSSKYTTKYDATFIKYTKRFFSVGAIDWRWFKSQSIAESALRPDAVSWCGAKGLMQLMPATADQIRKEQTWIGDTRIEEWNIAAGIYYDSSVIKLWNANLRNQNNLLCFMFGSYNAGGGNIAYYQKRCIKEGSPCGTCNDWCGIIPYSNKESIGYIVRIFSLMDEKY
jgi:membrane-bound lytic murein transglycosylase F